MSWSIADLARSDSGDLSLRHVHDLSQLESAALASANRTLKSLLGRTTFSVLMTNYRSYVLVEQGALASAASANAIERMSPEAMRNGIVTSVVNFLTSMRMFLDHTEAELKRRDTEDGSDRFTSWKAVCRAEYDDYFAYRFLYRFRNYIQHVGLPLSSMSIHSSLDDTGEVTGAVFIGESPHRLLEDYNGWSTVAAELQALSGDIDLSDQIHVAMECLTRIAEALLKEDVPELRSCVETFNELVGDLDDYEGSPWLVEFTDDPHHPVGDMAALDLERFEAARLILTEP